MGARIDSQDGKPPLDVHGTLSLQGIDYELPVASAQVKSAVLLAGLYASGSTRITEPAVTRDHTERMLASMGVDVERDGPHIGLRGGQQLRACDVQVPGDLSSAAFIILAGCIGAEAEVLIEGVGVNPTRTGVIDILTRMGADIRLEKPRTQAGEPVADIRVRGSRLTGIDVDPELVPLAIDEFPLLFVAAACAKGATRFSGIGELRVKESDRIAAMAAGLHALGIDVEEFQDGAVVHGGRLGGGVVDSCGDHRIAMALAVAGSVATGSVTVRNADAVATSFPGFAGLLASIGLRIKEAST